MDKVEIAKKAYNNPFIVMRATVQSSLYQFFLYFWDVISSDPLVINWHIPYLCEELEAVARRVANREVKLYDMIVNIPPGTTKTKLISVVFPAWCWCNWFELKFITASYSGALALEAAELSKDIIESVKFKQLFPELDIRQDKQAKSNFQVVKIITRQAGRAAAIKHGGNRFSTSVGGTLTGYHGHILIWDDPLNPQQSISDKERTTANNWISQTLSTRKTDKQCSVTIGVMQRLHEDDPTGYLLKRKKNIRHISLPGEIKNYATQLKPKQLAQYYIGGLLDAVRMPWHVLKEMEEDLGQYGFAGQVGQTPTKPTGGMFQADKFIIIDQMPPACDLEECVRYWDKAGSQDAGAYTAGVKTYKVKGGRYLVANVKRGQWATHTREAIIKATAIADTDTVKIWIEQEPGSGGKESAENTKINLAGFACYSEHPTGDKVYRADPYSVQVNEGRVMLLRGDWNTAFIDEHRLFPLGKYKDQVDASAGGFNKLVKNRIAISQ